MADAVCFLWTFFLTLNPHSSSKLLPIIYPSGLSSDTTVSGKPRWLRLPSQDSGSCLIHHHILSITGPYVTFVLTEGKKQAKDIVSKSVLHRTECKKWQTSSMFALKAHQVPMPSPDASEGSLGLGPSGAGWAQALG